MKASNFLKQSPLYDSITLIRDSSPETTCARCEQDNLHLPECLEAQRLRLEMELEKSIELVKGRK